MKSRRKFVASLIACMLLMIGTAFADMTLPHGLTVIEDQAFMNDTGLFGTLSIPEGVTTIGKEAFYGCTGIDTLVIPYSVESIESRAFAGCSGLTGTVVLPYDCEVAEDAFDGSEGLTVKLVDVTPVEYFTYEIADGEVTITGFDESCGITDVVIPAEIEGCPVKSIGSSAFEGCSGVENVTLPEGVQYIGVYAFRDCTSLTNVTIPKSVVFIDDSAFCNCRSLESVVIPMGVEAIDEYAFMGCSRLNKISLPDSLTYIGEGAFFDCDSLTTVVIPDSVTYAGAIFTQCTNLESVTLSSNLSYISSGFFMACSSLNNIVIPESVTSIGSYAFSDCISLTNLTIPESVTSIGVDAFQGCSSLTSIVIPAGVTNIDENAFLNCINLTSITIPPRVTSIESSAFSGCDNLTIFGASGSYAETYALENGINFEATEYPPLEDMIAPGDHYYLVAAYSYNGTIYGEAVLSQEYNGVAASSFFFVDTDGRPITDPEIVCVLWTMRMYRQCEKDIDSNIDIMHTSAKIWSESAKDFMRCEAVWSSGGTAIAEMIKAYASGGVTFLQSLHEVVGGNLMDGNEVSTWLQIAVIDHLLDYMDKMEAINSSYSATDSDGIYMYDEVIMKLSLYANYYYTYEVAKELCIPVVENIIDKYENNGQVFMHMVWTMVNETITGICPAVDACFAVYQSCCTGDTNSWDLVDILLSSMDELNPVEQTFQSMTKTMMLVTETLGTMTKITGDLVQEENEWLEPYYKTPEEIVDTPMYQNHLKLAQ